MFSFKSQMMTNLKIVSLILTVTRIKRLHSDAFDL